MDVQSMKITVAAFYADIPHKPSRLSEFLPFIYASKRALEITNPYALYVILTDIDTARLLPKDILYSVVCPVYMPLMLKIIFAQRLFIQVSREVDLVILPDVDCLANQDLRLAIPDNVGFATTHRGPKFEYSINNLAYIRDKELAVWFFDRAFEILKGWPPELHEWEGDQAAWQAALAPPPVPEMWYDYEDLGGDVLVSRPAGRDIYVYPCETHNCIIPDGGNFKPKHFDAFMVHFKGDRKRHLDKWMKERFDI